MPLIYRYRAINKNSLSEVLGSYVWFSRFDLLNDPFEGMFRRSGGEDEVYEAFLQQLRVCSFSARNDNLSLWAHYADQHQGMCLEYTISEEVFQSSFFAVKYSSEVPTVNSPSFRPNGTLILNANRGDTDFLMTKSTEWEREEEYRMLTVEDKDLASPGRKNGAPGELTGIYFGSRAPDSDIAMVRAMLGTDSAVALTRASAKSEHYSMEFEPIK